VLAGMAFRWWAFRRFVFPDQGVRRQVPPPPPAAESRAEAA
jgi:hypothetical protein